MWDQKMVHIGKTHEFGMLKTEEQTRERVLDWKEEGIAKSTSTFPSSCFPAKRVLEMPEEWTRL
jgi:hypothetical protein